MCWTLPETKFAQDLIKKISQRHSSQSLLSMELRPRCKAWQQLMQIMCNARTLLAGWGCGTDQKVVLDTFGINFIEKRIQHQWMSNNIDDYRLLKQFQLVDLQKAAIPTHLPITAAYDACQDPMNVPPAIKLDICAALGLTGAITCHLCAFILQDFLFKYNHVGYTEPKLIKYFEEAGTIRPFMHAPVLAPNIEEPAVQRGINDWVGHELAPSDA